MNSERRPKDMTEDELNALPKGPNIEEIVPYTREDIEAGARGRYRVKITARPVRASYYQPGDWIGWRDAAGNTWTFGQFEDGSWFKQPAPQLGI